MDSSFCLVVGALFAVGSVLSAAGVTAGKTDSGRYLYKDGEPQGRLFLPVQGGNPALRLAEEELQSHLQAITGKRLEPAYRTIKADEPGFVLALRPESEWRGAESAQAYAIDEDAAAGQVRITGNTGVAVLYGVYQYLNGLGVRWLAPGDAGANIPRLADIRVGKGSRKDTPSFTKRGLDCSGYYDDVFDVNHANYEKTRYENAVWHLRNRLHFERHANKGYFEFNQVAGTADHSLKTRAGLATADFEKEPERFPLVTRDFKQQRVKTACQICFTNEKNIQTAIESAIVYFKQREETKAFRVTDLDEASDTFSIGLSDAGGICECPACAKVAGTGPNRQDRLVWSYMNRVARGLRERVPNGKLGLFAPYFELTQPPPDVRIESNIVAVSCRSLAWENLPENEASYPFTRRYREDVLATAKAGAEMACYEYLKWDCTPQSLDVLDAAKAFKELGYSKYHAEVMQRNDLMWPILWSLAAYTWDSSRDPCDYFSDYCRDYFGETNAALAIDLYARIGENARGMERIIYGGIADTALLLPDATIASFRGRFKTAILSAQGKARIRLQRFANAFEMAAQMAEIFRAHCAAVNERTPEAIAEVGKRLANFQKLWAVSDFDERCSPGAKRRIEALAKTDYANIVPKGRSELADSQRFMNELFAGTAVPEKAPDLFKLPEVWRFRLDGVNEGRAKHFESPAYDDGKGWQPMSTWNYVESQGYGNIGGAFWYRLVFKAPAFPAGRRIMLRIGSLDDAGEVFLNGKKVGESPNSVDWDKSFEMDVTDTLKPGADNLLAVRGYDASGGAGVWRPSALYTK